MLATQPKTSVLISGAGIAGPTLAYWLRRRGFEPVMVERAPEFRDGGYILDFWGVGVDVAERMNILPALRQAGYINDHIAFVRRNGRRRSSFGGAAVRRAVGDRFLSVQRGDLARIVFHTVRNEVETIFGDEILTLTQLADRVLVTFKSGKAREFDLVVGAGGLQSAVRRLAFPGASAAERYLGYYAAAFVTNGYSKRDEHTYLSYAAPGRQVSRFALRDGQTGFLFVFARDERVARWEHRIDEQKAALRAIFSRDPWMEWPEIEQHLMSTDNLYFDAVSQVQMPMWSSGRVALVGDAAHAPSLLAGEGSSFAMAGAYILAGELERAEGRYEHAFAEYERKFHPFILRKQKAARAFASSFTPKTALGLLVRDIVLRLTAIPAVADYLMQRFVSDRYHLPVYEA